MSVDLLKYYKYLKEEKKRNKRNNLSNADDTGWNKYTSHHWYRETSKGVLQYYPSTNVVVLNNKRYNISDKFIKQILLEDNYEN